VSRWTEADLQVIREAVDSEQGLEVLRKHFGPQGLEVLGLACQAADDLVASRTTEAGKASTRADVGLRAERDFGPLGHPIAEVW
jgi:hypothetical protein